MSETIVGCVFFAAGVVVGGMVGARWAWGYWKKNVEDIRDLLQRQDRELDRMCGLPPSGGFFAEAARIHTAYDKRSPR